MQLIVEELIKRGISIATAESCTGGLVGAAITAVSGSSEIYPGGIIAYSNDIKQNILGVNEETLIQYGAVSEEVALEMASGVKKLFNSRIGLSVSGIAGPGGGSREKPVGTVCLGFVFDELSKTSTLHFKGNRQEIREQSVAFIFETLRDL
jgi:PncC family amidohydrolase